MTRRMETIWRAVALAAFFIGLGAGSLAQDKPAAPAAAQVPAPDPDPDAPATLDACLVQRKDLQMAMIDWQVRALTAEAALAKYQAADVKAALQRQKDALGKAPDAKPDPKKP